MGGCEGARLGDLSRHRSSCGPEIVEAIPDLDNDEQPMPPVAKADVDRQRGIGRARRQLELRRAVIRRGEAKQELLSGEVSRVSRCRNDVAGEANRQRPTKGDPDRGPRCDGRALTVTGLEMADLRLAKTDSHPELRLRESASTPR
jgi:hypothetical protein